MDVKQFKKENDISPYFMADEPPYTVTKVVKLKDDAQALDFKTKQVSYIIKQIPGFRIFLVHAGFWEKPSCHVEDAIIEKQIANIIAWYTEKKLSNKRERNYYEIK